MDPEHSQDSHGANPRSVGIDTNFLKAVLSFGLRLHESLDSRDVANCAANDGLKLSGSERLAVAVRRGRRLRIIAISGQEKIVHRSESVRRLETLLNKAIVYDRPIVYSGNIEEIEPALAEPMTNYLEESRSRLVVILPLTSVVREIRVTEKEEELPVAEKPLPFGALVSEVFGATLSARAMPQRTRLVADQVQSAMAAAERYNRIPFHSLLTKTGAVLHFFRGSRLAYVSVFGIAIIAAALSLTFIRATYRVSCRGTLMPVKRSQIFAPLDGTVIELLVSDGSAVKESDVLAVIQSETLNADRVTAEVAVSERQKLVESLENELSRPRANMSEEELIRLQGELTRAEIEWSGAVQTLEVIERRFESRQVRATVDGIVTGFQLRDELLNRPVSRGQRLLAVVEPDGDWQLELMIDEHKAGPVLERFQTPGKRVRVRYLMATDVSTTRNGWLQSIAKRADESPQSDKLIVEATASISPQQGSMFVGAEVFAKIECDQRALGYVLFGDVIDFLRRNLWF